MTITNNTTNSFFNDLDNNTTSGVLAPTPPITGAISTNILLSQLVYLG